MAFRVDPTPAATIRFHDARMSFHRVADPMALPPTFTLRRMAPRTRKPA